MALKTLVSELRSLSKPPINDFVTQAQCVAEIHDEFPAECKHAYQAAKLTRRHAYHLLDIGRAADLLPPHKTQVLGIGWTKIAVIAPDFTIGNIEERLQLAATNSVQQLRLS